MNDKDVEKLYSGEISNNARTLEKFKLTNDGFYDNLWSFGNDVLVFSYQYKMFCDPEIYMHKWPLLMIIIGIYNSYWKFFMSFHNNKTLPLQHKIYMIVNNEI